MGKTNEQLWQEYHNTGSEEARIALYENNRGIIIDCAKRWQYSYGAKNIEFEDLYGEGVEAILTAMNSYKAEKGTRFITHATNCINAKMQQYVLKNTGAVRLPEEKLRSINRIRHCRPEGEFPDEYQWYENYCDKYEEMLSFEQFLALVRISENMEKSKSLNELLGDESKETLLDAIGSGVSPEEAYIESTLSEEIDKCLAILTEKEQRVIAAYYGLGDKEPMTLKEIATELGVSIARVGDVRSNALKKLKQSSQSKGLQEYI